MVAAAHLLQVALEPVALAVSFLAAATMTALLARPARVFNPLLQVLLFQEAREEAQQEAAREGAAQAALLVSLLRQTLAAVVVVLAVPVAVILVVGEELAQRCGWQSILLRRPTVIQLVAEVAAARPVRGAQVQRASSS